MRFAEVFLRLGVGLVSWMLLYAHFLWLAAIRNIGCGPDGVEMHLVLLGLVPLTLGAAFLVRVTKPLAEVHALLRWLAIPLALLLPLCVWSSLIVLRQVNLLGQAICESPVPDTWQYLWAPVQIIALIVIVVLLIVNHRRAA